MAKSSLLGMEPVNPVAPGHDDLALGPSDSSDSGSDVAGLESLDVDDPQAPVDQALADDAGRPLGGPDARGGGSDTAGTGERRSAGSDAGRREAGDISVDRVFSPFGDGDMGDEDDDPDAPRPADVAAAAVNAPVDEIDDTDDTDDENEDNRDEPATDGNGVEDESADPVGDGRADAALAASLPPRPGQPNPQPDPPDDDTPIPADADGPVPEDDHRHHHQPGRDPGR